MWVFCLTPVFLFFEIVQNWCCFSHFRVCIFVRVVFWNFQTSFRVHNVIVQSAFSLVPGINVTFLRLHQF